MYWLPFCTDLSSSVAQLIIWLSVCLQKSQDWILFSKLHVLRQFSLRLFNSLWATCFCDWLSCQAKPKPPPSAEVLGKEDRKDEQDEKECKKDQDPGNPKTPEHSPTCGAWHLRTLKREKMECNSCARFGRSRLDAMFANIPEGKLFVLLRIFCLQQCKCSACSHVSDVKLQWVHAWSVDLSGAFIRNFLRWGIILDRISPDLRSHTLWAQRRFTFELALCYPGRSDLLASTVHPLFSFSHSVLQVFGFFSAINH